MARFLAALPLVLCFVAPIAAAGPAPVVVELFTSQSCSSCPPADAFLSDLDATRPDVLALDLHVTYWDQLGWKDPYSLDAATQRQQRYADQFGTGQVYTPQMVIGGTRQAVGSNRAAVLAAISAAKMDASSSVPLDIAVDGKRLRLAVGAGSGSATLLLVAFDLRHTTAVRGGENGGRTLSEVNVVRSIDTVAAWDGKPVSLAVDRPPGDDAVLLLQAPDGRFLGAALLKLTS